MADHGEATQVGPLSERPPGVSGTDVTERSWDTAQMACSIDQFHPDALRRHGAREALLVTWCINASHPLGWHAAVVAQPDLGGSVGANATRWCAQWGPAFIRSMS